MADLKWKDIEDSGWSLVLFIFACFVFNLIWHLCWGNYGEVWLILRVFRWLLYGLIAAPGLSFWIKKWNTFAAERKK